MQCGFWDILPAPDEPCHVGRTFLLRNRHPSSLSLVTISKDTKYSVPCEEKGAEHELLFLPMY